VYLRSAQGLTVGTSATGQGNTINANTFGLYAIGVSTGSSAQGNTISNNTVNVDTAGSTGGNFQQS